MSAPGEGGKLIAGGTPASFLLQTTQLSKCWSLQLRLSLEEMPRNGAGGLRDSHFIQG